MRGHVLGRAPALPGRERAGHPPGALPRPARRRCGDGEGARRLPGRLPDRRVPAGRRATSRRPGREAPRERQAARTYFSGAVEITPDKQGRVAIPRTCGTYAELEREVIVAGNFDHIEIWDSDTVPSSATSDGHRPRSSEARASTTSCQTETARRTFLKQTRSPVRRARLQPLGRRGCWPLLRPLSAVADPGRHPGRCLSTGGLEPGPAARCGSGDTVSGDGRGGGVLASPGDGSGGGGAPPARAGRTDRRLHGRWRQATPPLLLDARPDVRLLGIDRDADAVAAARSPARTLRVASTGGARRIRAARRAGRPSTARGSR